MGDRVIQAFYYLIGGLVLGIAIAINWSYFINTHTSSTLIILIATFSSATLGFIFPKSIHRIFNLCWNLFR